MPLALVTPADASSDRNRDLRRELQDAQASREAADATARQAKGVADKAGRLLREAADNVQRLRASMEAAQRAITAHRAEIIAKALQDGIEPSAMPSATPGRYGGPERR